MDTLQTVLERALRERERKDVTRAFSGPEPARWRDLRLTEAEREVYASELERAARVWLLCEGKCPGLEGCTGWRINVYRIAGVLQFRVEACPQRESHIARLRQEARLASSQFPPRLQSCSFDNWQCRPGTEDAFGICQEFVARENPAEGPGIVLVGEVGTGKTHLVAAVVNVLRRRGVPAIFVDMPSLLSELRRYFTRDEDPGPAMQELVEAPVLVLDDIGAERASPWTREVLFTVINGRYLRLRPILVTSNLWPQELEEQVGRRVASRLVEMCDWVQLACSDYRMRRLQQ